MVDKTKLLDDKGAFKKGHPKIGGRKKGTPNSSTLSVKAALEQCYNQIGGDANLARWAVENETEFYKLWGKLLPKNITLDTTPTLIIRNYAPKSRD